MVFLKNQQFFFLLLVVPILPDAILALDTELYQYCYKNFTNNGILQSNINNLVIDMTTKASVSLFAISSSGTGNDTIYGIASCQGDMSHDECSVCIADATQKIRTACPDAAKTRIWYKDCFLHYDTSNFIGTLDKSYASVWWSNTAAENPKEFEQGVAELMAEVMAAAAGGRSKFDSGETFLKGSGNITIYGMAQCTQDLEESDCNQCLEYSLEVMTFYCGSQVGCRIFGSSCVLRYEIYKFLQLDTDVDAPAPAPST